MPTFSASYHHRSVPRLRRTTLFVGALTGGLPEALAAKPDMICIDLEDAVLGGKVRIETPTGPVEMNVPAMTSSGRTFRLRGKGLPTRGGRGDLLATAEIRLPAGPDQALVEYAQARRGAKVD